MLGVITVSFDPVLRLTDTASVRIETIGLAAVLLIALALAARSAARSPVAGLRLDDLAFMVVGAVPGAIIGGRLGYVLDHLDFYRANPEAMLDPAQGALSLTLAVPFGLLTGSIVGRLLRAPITGWMHTITLPLLFALAAGKLIGVLGGSGQGLPSDGQWATAYAGPGPWGSLAPDLPSHPSQVYEAILVTVAIVALWLASRTKVIARRDGGAMFAALGLWAIARFFVASTWRDPALIGPLQMDQILSLGVLLVAVLGLVERSRAPLRTPTQRPVDSDPELA
ncbi:MAG: prolipoprotein diacylglyceryl transferase family protein [Candidatus Limnocylindrales bacterium]